MKQYDTKEASKILETFTKNIESVNIATVSKNGEPFASYSPFVEDEQGNYYVFISTAVKHSHNMNANKKVHIMFLQDESKSSHIYARERLYFKALAEKFEENDDRAKVIFDLFKKRFQDRISFFPYMKDFRIYKLIPSEGNLVLGFGSAFKIADDGKTLSANKGGHSTNHEEGLKSGQ